MKLQIVSDVHVELLKTNNFSEIQLKPKADTVVLLGDIGCPSEETYIKYVNFYINNYKKVFIIAGNHEFYHGEYHSTKQKIIELFSQVEKVTFLDRTSILHENVRFLGCTLWSYVNEHDKRTVETTLGDYYEIELKKNDKILKIKVEDTNFFHEIELKWLKSEIKNAEKNGEVTVVLTHHAPVFEGVVDPKHVGSSLGCAFSTYLNNMLGGNIAAWCFGHTHYSSSQLINGTLVISNQVGMIQDKNNKFDPELVIDIPQSLVEMLKLRNSKLKKENEDLKLKLTKKENETEHHINKLKQIVNKLESLQ